MAKALQHDQTALNRFFGMTQAPFQAYFLTSLGLKKPGQVITGHKVGEMVADSLICDLTPVH